MPSVTVAVIVENGIIRNGIQALLSRTVSEIHFIEFHHISGFIQHPQREDADVIIWDDTSVDMTSTYRNASRLLESGALVIIGEQLTLTSITQLVGLGVSGIIYRQDVRDDVLQDALRCVMRGAVYVSPSLAPMMSNGQMVTLSLSTREKQVLQRMAAGHSIPDIARQLHLSKRTVYRYRRQLREALGVPTNEQIIDVARQYGLIDAE